MSVAQQAKRARRKMRNDRRYRPRGAAGLNAALVDKAKGKKNAKAKK